MHPDELLANDTGLFAATDASDSGGVTIRWLGTAGFELAYDGTTVLIDPYLTRVGLAPFLFRPIRPDVEAIDRYITGADAILIGHSHFDHVMDTPTIAKKYGSVVYGSRSTANLMQACGLPSAQVVEFEDKQTFEVGPFRITAVPSLHSPFAIGAKVPYEGEIPCTCELPIKGKHYKCGQVFSYLIEVAGRTIYHLGSANLIEDEIPKTRVDLLLVCIAARFATKDFEQRMLRAIQPQVVMPMHYDNFFRAAGKTMKLLPRTQFGRFVDSVGSFSKEMTVHTLPFMGAGTLTAG